MTLGHVIRHVQRDIDKAAEDALNKAAAAYVRADAVLSRRRASLQEAVIAAVRAGLTKSEAARRAGWTREYVTRLIDEANKKAAVAE